jgi:hypothetical protein
MSTTARAALPGALLGLALGLLALGPALGRGFVLLQDMVFVPGPEFSAFTFGLAGGAPRVVPSDPVVVALSQVLPAELVQKGILLGIFVLAASGASVLVPSPSFGPRLVAGAFYAWNPYVAERLLIGQWALLLGYAGLPWVVHAVTSRRRLWLALLPAGVGGFAAMTVTAVTVVPVAAGLRGHATGWGGRWYGRVAWTGALVGLFSSPWLLATLARPESLAGDPVGVDAFAARADGPFGAVGSLLSLGGIWNAYAVPLGYEAPAGAAARLALAVAGIVGFAVAGRRLAYRWGLGVAAVAGFAIACLGVGEAGRDALKWLVGVWGGFAVFRDAQQFVAPLALLVAVGLGLLAAEAVTRARAAWVVGVLVPVAVLPTLAWGAFGALEAVPYPRSWYAAREVIRQDGAAGDVLVLPFESYRRFAWNGGRAVLDPAQRFFAGPGRRVVSNDTVRVGELVVGSEDPRAREVERVLEGPSPDLAGAGFRYVIVDGGTVEERKQFAAWVAGARIVVDAPELRLYRVDGPVR